MLNLLQNILDFKLDFFLLFSICCDCKLNVLSFGLFFGQSKQSEDTGFGSGTFKCLFYGEILITQKMNSNSEPLCFGSTVYMQYMPKCFALEQQVCRNKSNLDTVIGQCDCCLRLLFPEVKSFCAPQVKLPPPSLLSENLRLARPSLG